MADETKSFSELLSEAPLAAQEDTVSLVGALGRSNQPGKFVLALSSGRSITLGVDAVKGHQVLGGGVGQSLVQVQIDAKEVPLDVMGSTGYVDVVGIPGPPNFGPTGYPDVGPTGHHDVPSPVGGGHGPGPPKGMTWTDEITWVENIPDPSLWGDPSQLGGAYAAPTIPAAAPFALATPHQAPQSTIAAMQGGPIVTGRTVPWWDLVKHPWQDVKHPWWDGATGRPPYLD